MDSLSTSLPLPPSSSPPGVPLKTPQPDLVHTMMEPPIYAYWHSGRTIFK